MENILKYQRWKQQQTTRINTMTKSVQLKLEKVYFSVALVGISWVDQMK